MTDTRFDVVLRDRTVTGVRQDEDGITLDADTPGGSVESRAAYAVGCDGAGSTVRFGRHRVDGRVPVLDHHHG